MRTDFQHLLIERDDSIVTIKLNRPQVLNAFNDLMLQEFIEATEAVAEDETIRCVIIAGAGRAFGAGQDLAKFVVEQTQSVSDTVRGHLQHYHRLVQTLHEMPKPVIAAIHGVATGVSLNLALACDLRIVADNARLAQGFVRIGLVPDGGGAYFLPRLVGLGKALEMALLADEVSGPEAERLGLANKCVPLAELEATTRSLAQRLAHGPTSTYGLIKELMYTGQDSDLQTVFALEGDLQARALLSADHHEGVTAFLQKRPPKYSGK